MESAIAENGFSPASAAHQAIGCWNIMRMERVTAVFRFRCRFNPRNFDERPFVAVAHCKPQSMWSIRAVVFVAQQLSNLAYGPSVREKTRGYRLCFFGGGADMNV